MDIEENVLIALDSFDLMLITRWEKMSVLNDCSCAEYSVKAESNKEQNNERSVYWSVI